MPIEPVDPCPECGSTSPFHRRHPVTDREINYERSCSSCRHHSERTIQKRAVYACRHAVTDAVALPSYPACPLWARRVVS